MISVILHLNVSRLSVVISRSWLWCLCFTAAPLDLAQTLTLVFSQVLFKSHLRISLSNLLCVSISFQTVSSQLCFGFLATAIVLLDQQSWYMQTKSR